MSDVTFDMSNNQMKVHQKKAEPWRVTLVDTGEDTLTGGRLKRVSSYLEKEEAFCFTYGDGVANIDVTSQIQFHKNHGKLATVTAVQPPGRYGALLKEGTSVYGFQEKPPGDGAWINGGFFILSPLALELIQGDQSSWEGAPLETLANRKQLHAFEHRGFWQPMDTLRDKTQLEQLWASGKAPWKCWE